MKAELRGESKTHGTEARRCREGKRAGSGPDNGDASSDEDAVVSVNRRQVIELPEPAKAVIRGGAR